MFSQQVVKYVLADHASRRMTCRVDTTGVLGANLIHRYSSVSYVFDITLPRANIKIQCLLFDLVLADVFLRFLNDANLRALSTFTD